MLGSSLSLQDCSVLLEPAGQEVNRYAEGGCLWLCMYGMCPQCWHGCAAVVLKRHVARTVSAFTAGLKPDLSRHFDGCDPVLL